MTRLSPITKMMAHLPMAHVRARRNEPLSGLVICMGMGTSFRSIASWGGKAAVVELVPSVPVFFPFYFPDAATLLSDGRARIAIDDGRRFLDRRDETFDVITVDPPPPAEASGSSLLYSKEFYRSAARRLKPGGILQAWFPGGDDETLAAVTLALLESFPHVRGFTSIEGWGFHFLASQTPIARLSAQELLNAMPEAAVRDMTEWGEFEAIVYLQRTLEQEFDPRTHLLPEEAGGGTALTDDRPINEFFFVRRYLRANTVMPQNP